MRRDYDSTYKAFYEQLFRRWQIPVETQVEVSRRARTIDVVIRCEREHLQRLKDTAFEFFRRINDLELKSPEDPLNLADYMTIASRAYGLLAKQREEENQLPTNATLTIVCSVRPTKLLDDLQSELRFKQTSEPGVYLRKQEIDRRIIVATELDVIEKNYPLLILAKGQKLLEFLEEVVRQGLIEYVDILFQVSDDIETLTEGVTRMAEMHSEFSERLERALEKWIEFSPEAMQRIAPIRQFIEEQTRRRLEEETRTLEEETRTLEEQTRTLEEQTRTLEEQTRTLEEQRMNDKREDLLLLLGSRFGPLPEAITSQLDAMHDIDELSQMYRRALDAQTLEEVGLREET